jgi:hypothetical protein
MGSDFFRAQVTGAFFRPDANGVAKIKKLDAVDIRSRPAGFSGQDIGEFITVIEQEIAQPIKRASALAETSLLPQRLGLAAARDHRADLRGLRYR